MTKWVYWLENPGIRHHKVHWVNRIWAQSVHLFHLWVTMILTEAAIWKLLAAGKKRGFILGGLDAGGRVRSVWKLVFRVSQCPLLKMHKQCILIYIKCLFLLKCSTLVSWYPSLFVFIWINPLSTYMSCFLFPEKRLFHTLHVKTSFHLFYVLDRADTT